MAANNGASAGGGVLGARAARATSAAAQASAMRAVVRSRDESVRSIRIRWRARQVRQGRTGAIYAMALPERGHSPDLDGLILEGKTVESILDVVVTLVTGAIPTAHGASAAVVRTTWAARADGAYARVASDHIRMIDSVQYAGRRGPTMDSIRTSLRQNVALAEARHRWPAFAAAGLAEGYREILAVPLGTDGAAFGGLVLYSRDEGAFGANDIVLADGLARQASATLANAIDLIRVGLANQDLKGAMESRGVIGQAQGIIMAEQRCSSAASFDVLRHLSQRSNRKLYDVAAEIVVQHERRLPTT